MKKYLLIVLAMLLVPAFAMAATPDSMTAEEAQFAGMTGRDFRVVTIAVTWAGTPVALTNRTLRDIVTTAGKKLWDYGDWWLFKVEYLYGTASPPTDNSDLYIWSEGAEDRLDILGGNGVDAIDNATDNTIYPATSTQPLTGGEIIDIDNNAVYSQGAAPAVQGYIKLYLYK